MDATRYGIVSITLRSRNNTKQANVLSIAWPNAMEKENKWLELPMKTEVIK